MIENIAIGLGWDSRFPLVSEILRYSILKNTGVIDNLKLDFRLLDLAYLRYRFKLNFKYDPKATTEFTYTRFLVPYLSSYSGISIFMDNDMLCYGDLGSLIQQLFVKYKHPDCFPAIICRKHDYAPETGTKMYGVVQEAYPRKNWSSFMIMNCSKLLCWTKAVVEQADGARLHRFADIPDEEIVDIETIEPGWNDLTHKRPETKLLHFTEGGPWFKNYFDCPHAEDWFAAFREYFGYEYQQGQYFNDR